MSLMGKVVIINSLMASLFVYKMQVLPRISERIALEIKSAIEAFLRQGKHAKIPLNTLMLNKEDGGLGLVNICVKHESLLCNWITDCDMYDKICNLARYYLGGWLNLEIQPLTQR